VPLNLPNRSNPSNPSNRFLWLPVFAYMALIFGLSSVSAPPELPQGLDKEVHAALYAGLAALVVRALSGGWGRRVTLGMAIASAAIAAVYGISDEFHQSFVPLRQSEAADVLADTVGANAAAFGLYGWDIIRGRHGV
jgi:VanZ family protein